MSKEAVRVRASGTPIGRLGAYLATLPEMRNIR
jgi:hypothetical protein